MAPDESNTSITRSNTSERYSVFSWKDDGCCSVSENTKSKDFRLKRLKKQKGEYSVVKDQKLEILNELLGTSPQDNEHETWGSDVVSPMANKQNAVQELQQTINNGLT
ncbi:unnamed protein product [Heterobilharzia americana]|nr:unnamed protein product [Heterobilharzia americana]